MTVMDLGESFEVLFQDIRKYGDNCKLIVTFATLIGLTSLLTRTVRILLKCITGKLAAIRSVGVKTELSYSPR